MVLREGDTGAQRQTDKQRGWTEESTERPTEKDRQKGDKKEVVGEIVSFKLQEG